TTVLNEGPVATDRSYVLYWMTAYRRTRWNYSLQRALDWCEELGKPLVVLEALRCNYRWASDRLHAFAVQGMLDQRRRLDRPGVTYLPFVESEPSGGSGLLRRLAGDAAVVVSDDYPCFFLPAMVRAARQQVDARFELVDSNGLLPMRAADKVFGRAYDFRRFLQKNLPDHLTDAPAADPFEGRDLPRAWSLSHHDGDRWPVTDLDPYEESLAPLADLPIDHSVRPVEGPEGGPTDESGGERGGESAAAERLASFLDDRLSIYGERRNQPEEKAASNLSAHLHWGNISAHEVFASLVDREEWDPGRLAAKANGSREGWWGMSGTAESFLDEFITWRELGFNMCWQQRDFDRYESLPSWAQKTLEEHASDPREHVYTLEEFDAAQTHDDLWNAAQRQLASEGRIHNYLRMLWGKKILEWTEHPRDALAVMIELNNRYALDGRDPNSYSGIFWVLGRYDRAWGPERPIFGKIRYMSSDNTARKVRVKDYLRRYSGEGALLFD
ncbi:MAG: deoxyribodipyrimidine photolyase, partial [Planctomycetota bacterium]